MTSQTSRQAAAEQGQRTPVGTIHVVDPNPLNWLFITWNTMEEPVRTDERGHIVGAVMEDSRWVDGRPSRSTCAVACAFRTERSATLTASSAPSTRCSAGRLPIRREPRSTSTRTRPQRSWTTTRYASLPEPDGLVLGKFRGMHVPSTRFWEEEGFGYRKNGTGEGHW
jgi:hypothetical protein